MQIQVETLRHALSLLQPVVPKKIPTQSGPACQTILVGEGRAVANDLTVAVALEVPEAEGPPLCFPPMSLDFLKRVPGGIRATIEPVDGKVEIAVGPQRASFKSVDADDFPPMPAFDPEHEGIFEGDTLTRRLQAVGAYAATEDTRPVLTAICLTLGDSPRLAAADGVRLAWEDLPAKLPGEGNLLIPRAAVRPLAHLWKTAGGSAEGPHGHGLTSLALVQRFIRLGWRGRRLRLNWGTVTMMVELVAGSFPNYSQFIPEKFRAHVTVLAEDLDRALGAVAGMALDSSGIVRLEWAGRTLKVSARAEAGQRTEMDVSAACEPMEQAGRIAFNIRYLTDYLTGKQGMVKVSVYAESGPALLTYHGKGNHVLMPMGLQWDSPSPYPPEPEPEPSIAEAEVTFGPVHVGETGDPEGPKDDPVFSEETPAEDIEADMAPTPSDQPPTRAEATKPRRSRKAKAQAGA